MELCEITRAIAQFLEVDHELLGVARRLLTRCLTVVALSAPLEVRLVIFIL
ncbi:hypothetical protein NIES2104_56440 [Leptolyngbya sp. NIES-2104]|nr:hypothetical protein NIES2104_56440 [Leptolyngbya sp. NIES-2104]